MVTMLRCRDVATLASEYVDRDLRWRQRLAVRMHLMMCDACSRYVRQLCQVVDLLRRLRPDEAANEDAARLLFQTAQEPR